MAGYDSKAEAEHCLAMDDDICIVHSSLPAAA